MKYGKYSLWKNIVSSKITLIIMIVLLFVLSRAVIDVVKKDDVSVLKLTTTESELNKLSSASKELEGKIDYLSTEQGVEYQLRTKFKAVKEGELVAVIIDKDKQERGEAGTTTIPSGKDRNIWRKMISFLGL